MHRLLVQFRALVACLIVAGISALSASPAITAMSPSGHAHIQPPAITETVSSEHAHFGADCTSQCCSLCNLATVAFGLTLTGTVSAPVWSLLTTNMLHAAGTPVLGRPPWWDEA